MTQQEQVVKDLRSLRALRDETESLWDLAVDTAEEGRRDGAAEDRDAAMGCWADAINATRRRDVRAALEALDGAAILAREWGDDTPEQCAITLLERKGKEGRTS